MRPPWLRFGAASACAFLLIAVIAARAQGPQPLPQDGLIVGQVVDGVSGRPVSGAIVALSTPQYSPFVSARPAPPSALPVLTGSDGRFIFPNMPRGSVSITATKPGYAEGAFGRRRPGGPSQQLTLAESERVGDVVIRMWKLGSISGTVVDEAGEPMVSVALRAFRRSIVAGIRRFVDASSTGTDDRGMYRLGNLIPGEYVVGVVSNQTSVLSSTASAGQVRSELMEMAVAMSGTSIEVGGSVLRIGLGTAIPPPPSSGKLTIYPTTFYPSAPAAGQATIVTIGSGEERGGVDLQLTPVPTVRVAGTLSGLPGTAPMEIRLEPADVTDITVRDGFATSSGADGTFVFPGVPSGSYVLRVTPVSPQWKQLDNVVWAEQPIAVGRDDIVGLGVALQPGLRVSGRFEFEGTTPKPQGRELEQVGLAVEPVTGVAFSPRLPVRVHADGHFTSAGMSAGRYFVRVLGSPRGWMFKSASYSGRDVADVPLDLSSDASGIVITFTDRWSGLGGTVTSARGAADPEALVVLFPTDSQLWSSTGLNFRRMKSAQTTKTGEYVFAVVAPGDYYVAALRDRDAGDWQDPAFLEVLARVATQVRIDEGEKKTLDLRTQVVR